MVKTWLHVDFEMQLFICSTQKEVSSMNLLHALFKKITTGGDILFVAITTWDKRKTNVKSNNKTIK